MFEFVTFALAVASMVLHFVKGKTSNKAVAEASDLVDEAQKIAPVVAPMLGESAPSSAPNAQGVGFQPLPMPQITDHRTVK